MSTRLAAAMMMWRSSTAFTGVVRKNSFAIRSNTVRRMAAMPHDEDKMPYYTLGVNLARQMGGQTNFKTLVDDDELEIVLDGFCASMRGTELVSGDEALQKYGPALNKIIQERSEGINDRIKKEGEDYISNFMECNEEAIRTESGLVYYCMTEGTGKQPAVSDSVEVHYHGTLVDGTVFDSSVERGQTISFPLGQVIAGWQEGVALMKEGGKATLICPSDLAYGEAGSGTTIPPGATLKFEVELFEVK